MWAARVAGRRGVWVSSQFGLGDGVGVAEDILEYSHSEIGLIGVEPGVLGDG